MRTRAQIVLVLLVGFLLIAPYGGDGASAQTSGDAAVAPPQTDLNGKVILVYGKSDESGGVLTQARVERLGSIEFLVGSYIDSAEYDWKRGARAHIRLDQINVLITFDSMEAYKKRVGAGANDKGGAEKGSTSPPRQPGKAGDL